MKTTLRGIAGGFWAIGLSCSLCAQSVTLDTSGLALRSPERLPKDSTYWVLDSYGVSAPYPCIPENVPNPQFWALPSGGFLVTSAGVNYTLSANQEALLAALMTPPDQNPLASPRLTMALADNDTDDAQAALEYPPASLYLIPPSLGTNATLAIANTVPGTTYEVQWSTNLASGTWFSEGTLIGTSNSFTLAPFTANGRESLFLRVRSCDAGCGDTMPLDWQLANFGQTGVDPDGDYNSNGVPNYLEYQQGTDPNKIESWPSVTNKYVNSSFLPVALNISGGVPGSIATLVDSTNFSTASWTSYSTDPTIDLGAAQGWHQVWIGLRGRLTTSCQTWRELDIKLDTTPPALVFTSPAVTAKPVLQIQGSSPEPLRSLRFDVSNAAVGCLVADQQGFVVHQQYDTNLLETTTCQWQLFDVPLTNGDNSITIRATDLAGNLTTTNLTITLDFTSNTNPPVMKLFWPLDGARISVGEFTLRGLIDDETAQVTAQITDTNGDITSLNGVVDRDGQFRVNGLPLADGTNTVIVMATDLSGYATTNALSVVKGGMNFAVTSAGDVTAARTTVSGNIDDPTWSVWVNGAQAQVWDDGSWNADNVRVYGKSVASFDAVAYPPGQGPSGSYGTLHAQRLAASDAAAGDDSSESASMTMDIPLTLCISSYNGSWTQKHTYPAPWADTITTSWSIDYSESLQQDQDGQYYRTWTRHAVEDHDDETGDASTYHYEYDWSDDDPVGTYQSTVTYTPTGDSETGSGEIPWNWEIDTSVPMRTYDYGLSIGPGPTDNGYPWYIYHNSGKGVNYHWDLPYDGSLDLELNADTQQEVRGGGDGASGEQAVYTIWASANENGRSPDEGVQHCEAPWAYTPIRGVPMSSVTVAGQTLGDDGNTYLVAPVGSPLSVTVQAPAKDYSAGPGVVESKLHISANDCRLDIEGAVPEFCVGQKVTFTTLWDQSPPGIKTNTYTWALSSKYVNHSSQRGWIDTEGNEIFYGSVNYDIDPAVLSLPSPWAWWVKGGDKNASVKLTVQFQNGQSATVSAKGKFEMFRPTTSNLQPNPPFFAALVPSGAPSELRLGDDNDVGAMAYTLDVDSAEAFGGVANIVQLINANRAMTGPLGGKQSTTDGQFWLDNDELYNGAGSVVSPPYPGSADLSDMPGYGLDMPVFLMTQCAIVDSFKDYVVFRPDGSDSIYVTLGRITWDWSASASRVPAKTDGVWTNVSSSVRGPTSPDDSDEFPYWEKVYTNHGN